MYQMIKAAQTGSMEGIEFEAKYSMEEIKEFTGVLEKMLVIREMILKVNQQYIYSAAQDDAYRTEPLFLLQGSYRNMNKMAEKVLPIMNEAELKQVILDHYTDESQLLTSGAEFNLLRFKEMADWLSDEEKERLEFIRETYQRNKKLGGAKNQDAISRVMGQFNLFNEQFGNLAKTIEKKL